jgi:altronate hydrolase
MNSCIQIHPDDTVAVALQPIPAGSEYCGVIAQSDIPQGHKMAMQAMSQGSQVMKYGFSITHSTTNRISGRSSAIPHSSTAAIRN